MMTMVMLVATLSVAAADATTLSLGEASAPPGAPVVSPLTLSAPDGVSVGAITVRLTFPKGMLAFDKVDPSGLSLSVDAVVEARTTAGPDDGSTMLEVRIAAKRRLPAGPLAYVGFRIDQDATPETAIVIELTAAAMTTDTPPRPVEPVVAAPASIRVSAKPVPACYFYMH